MEPGRTSAAGVPASQKLAESWLWLASTSASVTTDRSPRRRRRSADESVHGRPHIEVPSRPRVTWKPTLPVSSTRADVAAGHDVDERAAEAERLLVVPAPDGAVEVGGEPARVCTSAAELHDGEQPLPGDAAAGDVHQQQLARRPRRARCRPRSSRSRASASRASRGGWRAGRGRA